MIRPEDPARDAGPIEALYDATFGPGHFAKTAERLREGGTSLPALSRVADRGGDIVGVVRLWPILAELGGPAVFVGPVAVAAAARGRLLGLELTTAALGGAAEAGFDAALLIGSGDYFGRIGFTPAAHGTLRLPGPIDPQRLLVRDLAPGGGGRLAGRITVPRAATRA